MAAFPHRPPPRGCVRGCAGCLFHHPLTVLLTGIALLFWVAQLVRAGIALATARPLPLGALIASGLLVILAQLGPRLARVRWRRWRTRQAETATAAPASATWRDHPAGIWAANTDPAAYRADDPTVVGALMAATVPPRSRSLVVPTTSRRALLRHLDREAGLVVIDPFMEDHPDE